MHEIVVLGQTGPVGPIGPIGPEGPAGPPGGGGSVTSNEMSAAMAAVSNALSAEAAARVAADDALSNALSNEGSVRAAADSVLAAAINAVSNGLSAEIVNRISADNALSNSLSAEIANRISADNALSNGLSLLSVALAGVSNALSNEMSVRSVADAGLSARIDSVHSTLSHRLSTWALDNLANVSAPSPLSQNVLKWNSSQAQWVASTDATGGAGGSVTPSSAQFNSLSALVASEISNRLSAEALLSGRIDTVSNALSNEISNRLSDIASVRSNLLSAISVASAAASAADVKASNAQSDLNSTRSNLLSQISQLNSVVSTVRSAVSNVSTVSGAGSATGLQAVVDALANRISIASGLASAADVKASNAQSDLNSTRSNLLSVISALSQANSVAHAALSNAVSAADAKASNAQSDLNSSKSHLNSVVSHLQSVLSQRISAITLDALANVSAPSPTSQQVLKFNSAAGQWIASVDQTAGGASVTSAELSAAIAAISLNAISGVSVDGVTDGQVLMWNSAAGQWVASTIAGGGSASPTSNDHSVLSNALSVKVAVLQEVIRIVSNTQSTTASALVDVSGMVLTVAAGETWEVRGMALLSTSAATAGVRMGFSVPPLSTPRYGRFMGGSTGQSVGGAFFGGAGNLQVSGTSILLSNASTTPAGGLRMVEFMAFFNVASAGTFRLQFAGVASTAASPHHLLAGTYMICKRIK